MISPNRVPKPATRTVRCRYCQQEFVPTPSKPGRFDVCLEKSCQRRDHREAPEPPKLKGWTAWENKHTPVLTITDAHHADQYNALLNRHGHNACLPGLSNYSYEHDQQVVRTLGVQRERTAAEQEEFELKLDRKR